MQPVDADKIGFFFGAGASIEFGIPSMTQMTSSFSRKLNKKPTQKSEEGKIFDSIYNSLAKAYGKDKVDLEATMSVITGLKEKERLKENIGELGLFILEKHGIKNYAKKVRYNVNALNNLEIKFKKHIRNNVVIHRPSNIDRARNVFLDFFKQLCSVTVCDNSNAEDSDPWKYTHSKWTFFTTNYDTIIEDFWVRWRGYSYLRVGFEKRNGKKVMNADSFLLNNTSYATPNSSMQLVKLHGSVNWIRNAARKIEEHGYHLSIDDVRRTSGSTDIQEDIVIYPLSQKQLYFTPYMQLFRIFDIELRRRDFWIIIGYSFRDVIIRTMFERALTENSKRKVLLVHPHATEQIRPLFKEGLRNQLACLDSTLPRKITLR